MELEKKIIQLQQLAAQYETNQFLTFLAGILLQVPARHNSPFLKHLHSPMRQLFYLASLNLQDANVASKKSFNEEEWEQMSVLLHEIEMEYYYMLGFPKHGKETQEELSKIQVAMPTFMNYFFNGPISYQEQEIEKIERLFLPFAPQIEAEWGVTLRDITIFYQFLYSVSNENLRLATEFRNERNWQEFTDACIAKGLSNPKDWIQEAPEKINAAARFVQNPGSFLTVDLNKVSYTQLTREKVERLFELFTCVPTPKDGMTYYTEPLG